MLTTILAILVIAVLGGAGWAYELSTQFNKLLDILAESPLSNSEVICHLATLTDEELAAIPAKVKAIKNEQR